jgi:D-serine deaminase-like pyridoxal phosphate-dependent protein
MFQIKRPTLVIDKQKCMSNIEMMARKADRSGVIFRPHFKTHQSTQVAEWFRLYGVDKICVSSVEMASLFANAGWKDITIAFPVNHLEINEINELAEEVDLNLLVESLDSVRYLADKLLSNAGLFIEIDTGYHRSGIDHKDHERISSILQFLLETKQPRFKGFLVHSGNTYKALNPEQIKSIYTSDLSYLKELKKTFSEDFPDLILSIGDTPSCSLVEDFSGVDEIRPGNFVYYDIMQYEIGVCSIDDIAVAVACPVVGKNSERHEIVIYGGAVHLSKEGLLSQDGTANFGLVVKFDADGWGEPLENTKLVSLSQEHGIIRTTGKIFDTIERGQIVGILPVHSCLSNDLLLDSTLVLKERY